MILNAQQIIATQKSGDISISPFEESQVQAASYDLRVGQSGATTSTKKLVNIKETGYILLQPGDFAIVTVLEEIRLGPQYAARFGLRSKYARKGVIATTGPQIDPGYRGRLILGLTNLTPRPISIPYKDDFITIEFHRLETPTSKPYDGPYQGRLELGPEEIEAVTEAEGMAFSEVITTLRSVSDNVGKLASEVNTLRWMVPLIVAFGIGVIAVLVAFKH
jgi:dCTP deaminase